jgi:putative permease
VIEEQPPKISGASGGLNSVRWIPPPSIIWALGIALVVLIVYVSSDFVLLLFLSATLAYLINPIVKIAESAVIKRNLAVTVIYLGLGIAIVVTAYFLFPRLRAEVNTLSANLPSLGERLDESIDAIQEEIAERYPAAGRLFGTREVRYGKLNAFIEQQVSNLPVFLSHLAALVLAGVLIPFFSYFFLRDSRKIIQFVLDRLPPAHIETSVAVWCEIDRIVGRYLRGLAIDGTVVGVSAGLGLWMLGVNYPLLLGALSGLANVVPYLGPIFGGAAAMLVGMVQFKNLAPLTQIFLLYLSIKLFDVVVIQPIALGRSNHLHPALLIASIIVGGYTLGIMGMVISVPLVTILQETVRLLLEHRRYSAKMADSRLDKDVWTQPYVC